MRAARLNLSVNFRANGSKGERAQRNVACRWREVGDSKARAIRN